MQCGEVLISYPLPGLFIGPVNPHPSHAVPIFLGLWLLAAGLFELWQTVKHRPTISQWIKGVGLGKGLIMGLWIIGVVLLCWHLVWGGPF